MTHQMEVLEEQQQRENEIKQAMEALAGEEIIRIGMSHEDASNLLPQVVTRSGFIKKYPGYTRDKSAENTVNLARMAVRAMDAFQNEEPPIVTMFLPAGIIDLNPELAFYFESNQMWSDLAAKGWVFKVSTR